MKNHLNSPPIKEWVIAREFWFRAAASSVLPCSPSNFSCIALGFSSHSWSSRTSGAASNHVECGHEECWTRPNSPWFPEILCPLFPCESLELPAFSTSLEKSGIRNFIRMGGTWRRKAWVGLHGPESHAWFRYGAPSMSALLFSWHSALQWSAPYVHQRRSAFVWILALRSTS